MSPALNKTGHCGSLEQGHPKGLYCEWIDKDGDVFDFDAEISQSECEQEDGGTWYDNPTTTVTVNGDTGDVDFQSTGLNGGFDPFYGFSQSGAGAAGSPANNGQTWANCVKNSGNYFSLQNALGLQNSFWAGAILGNPVSDAIEGVQNVFSGNFSGAGGRGGSIFGGWAAGKGADAASQITNISLTTVAATTTTVQMPGAAVSTVSVNATTMTLPTGLLGQAAKVGAGALKGLNVWNYGVSAVSGMICAIGR